MTTPIPLDEAMQHVLRESDAPLDVESVPLCDALGRSLATDVASDVPWPVTDRSAMDGFAIAAPADVDAGARFVVVGESLAGHPFDGPLEAGDAIRIMTGAVVPRGATVVVPVERTGGFAGGEVVVDAAHPLGAHIRRAGSELAVGVVVTHAGTRIDPATIGVLAVLGIDPVPVFRRPVVAVLATGDEVVDVGRVPAPHQVRDSNSHAVAAQAQAAGALPLRLGIAADDAAALCAHLAAGLADADVVLTIGGVSKGTHDLVHTTLAELGVREVFHGVRLKPGMPTFFGVHEHEGRRRFVFGLPGNPASCFTVFDLLVRPLLDVLLGVAPEVSPPVLRVTGVPFPQNARLQAIRARRRIGEGGELTAELAAPRPSGDPFSLLHGDGYALIPPQAHPLTATHAPFVSSSGVGRLASQDPG